ncbi:MAG: carotenoid biosynthesis protein [Chloroflexi bacterium]|nr:carotenoid biosynthesis protein [Chloroflexota bacterium]
MGMLRRLDLPVTVIISLWVLTMVATPIVHWAAGEVALSPMVSAGVLAQAAAVGMIFWQGAGTRSALRNVLLILPLAWLVEFAGSTTGIPFGRYSYTEALQPQLGGVPLLIPFAWLMLLPPSWAVASRVVKSRTLLPSLPVRLARAGVAALAFTAWDLFLDPQMVAWGFWRWEKPGAYFGVPLVNFLGWVLASFLISCFFLPDRLPINMLLLVYAITWSLQSIGLAFFWGLPGPAVCGFLGMGGMLLWAFLRRNKWTRLF